MAVYEGKNPSSLKLKFDCGLNDKGRTIVRNRTYSNLRHDALSQDVLDVARALISLQPYAELDILKQDNTTLS